MNFFPHQLEVMSAWRTVARHDAGSRRQRGFIGTVALVCVVAGIAGPAFSQPRPLLQYLFEDGFGTRVANSGTVKGATGTFLDSTGKPTGSQFSQDTPLGIDSRYSLHLDGEDDVVSIPDDFDYTINGMRGSTPLSQLTIEAWIKPTVVGDGILSGIWDDYGVPGVFLGLRDNLVQFLISTSKDPGEGVSNYSGRIAAGVWQHIAAVYDGTQVKLYVDGQDTGVSVPTSGPIQDNSSVHPNDASITIGADRENMRYNYAGLIDDLRVFPAALTRDQLADGYFADRSAASGTPYAVSDRGAVSLTTSGAPPDPSVGYARVEPRGDHAAPIGLASFGFRENGVLVNENAVPASGLIRSGRIPVLVGGSFDTGISIANPFTQYVTINFYFTDESGTNFGSGSTVIPPYGQIARFLSQSPFNSGNPAQGTFTFTSDGPVAAIALRGLLNERDEFLVTTLPVVDITSLKTDPVVIPHYADGGGWTTEILLVNPGDTACIGTLQFYSQGSQTTPGQAISLSVDGATTTSFGYSIPGRSAKRLTTSSPGLSLAETGSNPKIGAVVVTPNTDSWAPTALVVFSHKSDGVTVTETAVPSTRVATAFRMFVENSGGFGAPGSRQSGLAVFNPSSEPVTVNLELTTMSGESTGLLASMDLPARGQSAMFLNQIGGFQALPSSFEGQLRISTSTPSGLAMTGLTGLFNERGDFLITTTATADETAAPSTAELIFPQVVNGGGYTTQLVLLSGTPGQDLPGRVRFFSQLGKSLDPDLH